jgi:hypothetical protein
MSQEDEPGSQNGKVSLEATNKVCLEIRTAR